MIREIHGMTAVAQNMRVLVSDVASCVRVEISMSEADLDPNEARFLARALAAAADRAEGTIIAAQETALDV